jgi:hypothetical protein
MDMVKAEVDILAVAEEATAEEAEVATNKEITIKKKADIDNNTNQETIIKKKVAIKVVTERINTNKKKATMSKVKKENQDIVVEVGHTEDQEAEVAIIEAEEAMVDTRANRRYIDPRINHLIRNQVK